MQKIGNPVPLFLDARGYLLDGGNIYLGVADGDPQTDPIVAYWDKELSIVAEQPIRTLGGRMVNGADPAQVYIAEDDYSMRICDSQGAQVDYSPSVFTDASTFQTHAANLDTLTAATLTAFGLSVLAMADASTLATALGLANALLKTGGTMTGDITKQGGGKFAYWNDSAMTSGRIFTTANGAADPTSQPGDLWLEKSS